MKSVSVDINSVKDYATLKVNLKVKGLWWFKLKLKIASFLIVLGCSIAGINAEIVHNKEKV